LQIKKQGLKNSPDLVPDVQLFTEDPPRKEEPPVETEQVPQGPLQTPPLFILAGEENMGGRCSLRKLHSNYYRSRFQKTPYSSYSTIDFQICWNNDSHLTPRGGSSSLDQWKNLRGQRAYKKLLLGPEFGIAKALGSRLTTRVGKVYFLKYTLERSNLHRNWNPLNTQRFGHGSSVGHFRNFMDFCKRHVLEPKFAVDNEQPKYKLAGMFWLQGETDSLYAEDAGCYLDTFQSFVSELRRGLKAPDLPVVVSPIVEEAAHADKVNEQLQLAMAGAVENCLCIDKLPDTLGLQTNAPYKHFLSSEAICEIGNRMGAAVPLEDDLLSEASKEERINEK